MGYNTDLTDIQWKMIEPIFTSKKGQNLERWLPIKKADSTLV